MSSAGEIERMTITAPAKMAAVAKSAVEAGDYASPSAGRAFPRRP
jgi:hypothetical protein